MMDTQNMLERPIRVNETNGLLKNLKALKRLSHFCLDEPSVTIRKNSFYLSSSSIEPMQLRSYKRCYLAIEESVPLQEASKLFLVPNNNPSSDENCTIKISRRTGAAIAATTTIVSQIPILKSLMGAHKKKRRFFLKKDETYQKWYIDLMPNFEYFKKDIKQVPSVEGIYMLKYKGQTHYIGESNCLARRLKEHSREDMIPFDTIKYSVIKKSEDDRKYWEAYHINEYVRDNGELPPYNAVSAKVKKLLDENK